MILQVKRCTGATDSNTYEKSFFLSKSVLQRYCVPQGSIHAPCGYRIVFNKSRMGEGKREYCIFCIKKLCSRDLTTDRVHNDRDCYRHAGIPDERAIARREAEKRKRDDETSEIRDLRQEVIRLRKRNQPESFHDYHYGAPSPPSDSVPRGSYVYYPPPGVLPPPTYPHPDTGY